MAFIGRWVLQSVEGDMKAFMAKTGTDAEKIGEKVLAGINTTGPGGFEVEYSLDGVNFNRKIYFKGELKKEKSGTLDTELEGEFLDGRTAQFTVSVSGDTITRNEKLGGHTAVSIFTADGDTAVATMTCEGVSIKRHFIRA